jgi:hypothetical protein
MNTPPSPAGMRWAADGCFLRCTYLSSKDLTTEARGHGGKKEKSNGKKQKAKILNSTISLCNVSPPNIFLFCFIFRFFIFLIFSPCLRASAIAPALPYQNTSMYWSVVKLLTLKPQASSDSRKKPIAVQ